MEAMRENMWAVALGLFLLVSVLFIGWFGDDAIRRRELERYEQVGPGCVLRPEHVSLNDLEPGDLIIWDANDAFIVDKWPTDNGHLDVMGHLKDDLFASLLFVDASPDLLVWRLPQDIPRGIRGG